MLDVLAQLATPKGSSTSSTKGHQALRNWWPRWWGGVRLPHFRNHRRSGVLRTLKYRGDQVILMTVLA